ncbi:MoaD/ThiS family protein [Halobellus captivus]|uniref:MoaD/ThiS family protein n=1 Tax=Halobellus captivus TaxID=2592614 RepID=UPI0011A1F4CD|nr:MoaD/ThiS family protein [Halobellus captivus]
MRIECVFFGPLRDPVGTKTVVVDTDSGTVRELLTELEDTYDGLDGRLLDGEQLSGEIVVTWNRRHVQHEDGLETALSEDDVIRLTTAVYGG